jgi:RNA polymerase sigma-70 factor, ECF subfamily
MNNSIEELWAGLSQPVAELICHKTNHQDHCHDILQEVFLKMVKNRDKIEQAENVLPYVLKLANNTVMDYYRAGKGKKTYCEAAEGQLAQESTSDDITARLASSFLPEMIAALPPIYRQALVRAELEGQSQKQLAEELNISYSGAKSRVQRAKEMLRQAILNCCNYKFDKYGNVISCCGSDCC